MVHACSYPTYDDEGQLETVEMYEEFDSECADCREDAIKSMTIEVGEEMMWNELPF
jgi:hypothetical protein